ncbi:distal tail protein Dit [Neobacillus vireti]|uniref:distal tail protein Dit n=1 Tax=Neobacillus vireti TaxID=220686 RepID=UPI002FFDE93B
MANFTGIIFNEIPMPDFVKVKGISHSILPPISQNLLTVGGKAGSYDFGNTIGNREITIDIMIVAPEENIMPQLLEQLSAWLYYDEPKELILGDNPNRYYIAKFTGDSNIKESFLVGEGTLTFLCTEPHIFGAEKEIKIPPSYTGDELQILNEGTADTFPQIYLKATKSITNLSIVAGDEYLDFGTPFSVDLTEDDKDDVNGYVLKDQMITTNGWTQASSVYGGTVTGSFEIYGGHCFRQSGLDYGSGSGWHGASLIKTFSENVKDFEAQLYYRINAYAKVGYIGTITLKVDLNQRSGPSTKYPVKKVGKKGETYKVVSKASNGWYKLDNGYYSSNNSAYSTYTAEAVEANKLGKVLFSILDSNGSPMVHAWVGDTTASYRSLTSEVRLVKGSSYKVIDSRTIPTAWHDNTGYWNIKRTGKLWEVSLYFWNGERYSRHFYIKWTDSAGTYQNMAGRLQVATLAYGTNPATYMELRDAYVINKDKAVNGTKIPLIMRAGDELYIDNETGAILLNDRPFYQYLNPSSTFIKFENGYNGLVISPADAFTEGVITFRERTL